MKDWLTPAEAAARLGVSTNAVYLLMQSRRLGHRKVGPTGGRYQVTEAHLAAYLESCEVAPKGQGTARAPATATAAKPRRGASLRADGKPLGRYAYLLEDE